MDSSMFAQAHLFAVGNMNIEVSGQQAEELRGAPTLLNFRTGRGKD